MEREKRFTSFAQPEREREKRFTSLKSDGEREREITML